ncbi:MAG: hypothetical protein BWY13_00764 [Euryarchaeota archaeon ADurb.Bin190]|nr:MAG: hypothetical protein BWY13_00764 [Euryarchaeota archaeon ADurb.Bin190]
MARALLAFCSTINIVTPLRFISSISAKSWPMTLGESAADGSSSMSREGLVTMALPTASIFCSPPLNVPALWPRRSASLGKSSKTPSSRSSISPARDTPPISRFSLTVRLEKTFLSWGT